MEEYTALVEQVQSGEAGVPDSISDTSEEISVTAVPWEQGTPTDIPSPVAETVDTEIDSINRQRSPSAGKEISPEADQNAIIIVIPGETAGTEPSEISEQTTSKTQTQEEIQLRATTKPVEKESGHQEIDRQLPKATQSTDKPAESPEIAITPIVPSPSPVIETPTSQPLPTATPVNKIGKTGVDLAACKTQNSDFVAWLKIPGTKINYPVVWTDRVDYYLTHTFSGKESKIGTLFSLGKTDYTAPGRNIAVYGHHITTSGGNMFQPLMSYKKKSYYETHKTVYFDTLYDLGEYAVFAVLNIKSTDWDASAATFKSSQDFMAFVNRAKAKSLYDTGIEVNENDHILTLITCDRDYHNPDGRLIVMAVKQ